MFERIKITQIQCLLDYNSNKLWLLSNKLSKIHVIHTSLCLIMTKEISILLYVVIIICCVLTTLRTG